MPISARVPALGHWPEVQLVSASPGTKVPAKEGKKDDKTQGLFDFSVIAA
jgi:hypothetical protein